MAGEDDSQNDDYKAETYPNGIPPAEGRTEPPKDAKYSERKHRHFRKFFEKTVGRPIKAAVNWIDAHNGIFTALATIVIAVATIVNVVYVGGQLSEMQSTGQQTDALIETNRKLVEAATMQATAAATSAKTAQEGLLASQRAWVGPRIAQIEGTIEIGKEVKVSVEVVNSGREPAKNFFWDLVGIPTDAVEDRNNIPAYIITKYVESCFKTPPQFRRQVVFPSTGLGGGFKFTQTVEGNKIDEGIINGEKFLIVQGCLAYEASGITRHSTFCFFYKANVTKPDNLNICTGGADAD